MTKSGISAPRDSLTAEMQRARIMDAVVELVSQNGLAGSSVTSVIRRAEVSRRTFYELYGGVEDCVIGIIDEVLKRACALVEAAFDQEGPWYERVRSALAAVLDFLDGEPDRARVCVVHALAGSKAMLEHRERGLEIFLSVVARRIGVAAAGALPLAFESVMAAVLGMIHARLVSDEREPLIGLLEPLVGVIVGPYLDAAAVAQEIDSARQLAARILAGRASRRATATYRQVAVRVPAALRDARAHRLRFCLLYVAAHPGTSNSEVGAGIGVSHRGQVSELLSSLEDLGLACKRTEGPGRPNAWQVSVEGELIAHALMTKARGDESL